MGSGSSSHVKNIQLEQKQSSNNSIKREREQSAKRRSFKSSKVANEGEKFKESKTNVTDDPDVNEDNSRRVEDIEKQLIESESQRLDLEDRVQVLEERLEYYGNQEVLKEEKTCDETLHAKDQFIAKLEKEKSDLELESNKVKQRSRKKIKQLSSQLSEYKQEANFQMMELREEISRLKEQNLALQESSGDHKPVKSETDDADNVPGGGKMKLILELSAQVTEQSDKISKLERKLKDRDQIIDELRVKLKNNMEYLKARDEVGNQRSAVNNKNSNNNQMVSKSHPHNQNHGRKNAEFSRKSAESSRKTAESSKNNIDSLFAVNEENSDEEFDDAGKMEKLTTLLQGVRSKNDKLRQSTDSLDDGRVNDNDDLLAIKGNEEELRKFSGTSRDSGLGSAGKQRKVGQDKVVSSYGQKEYSFSLESGLSDTDLDDFGNITGSHSQITSAPPTLQRNAAGQKLKKTSSLKRRVSQKKDRTDKPNIPKPSLAFVNSAQRPVNDNDIFQIPGSSGLSSVQVS